MKQILVTMIIFCVCASVLYAQENSTISILKFLSEFNDPRTYTVHHQSDLTNYEFYHRYANPNMPAIDSNSPYLMHIEGVYVSKQINSFYLNSYSNPTPVQIIAPSK